MIVIQWNLDTLDRTPAAVARDRRRRPPGHRPRAARCASRSTCPSASSSSSSSTPSSPPSAVPVHDTRPTTTESEVAPHAGHPAPDRRGARRGGRQPSAVRHQPARARLRPHARQLAAPHAAVVDPRRGRHPGPLRRRAPRVRHHRRASPRTSPTSSSTSRTSCSASTPTSRSRCASTCAARPTSPPADIQPTADVEILNPDLHIATLNGKGRLAIDITVEQGRGYVSADRNKTLGHHRRDPGRLDLLAGAAGDLRGRADPRRAVDRTTTASCSTSRPTARSRPARRWPRPAPRCARWCSSSRR